MAGSPRCQRPLRSLLASLGSVDAPSSSVGPSSALLDPLDPSAACPARPALPDHALSWWYSPFCLARCWSALACAAPSSSALRSPGLTVPQSNNLSWVSSSFTPLFEFASFLSFCQLFIVLSVCSCSQRLSRFGVGFHLGPRKFGVISNAPLPWRHSATLTGVPRHSQFPTHVCYIPCDFSVLPALPIVLDYSHLF